MKVTILGCGATYGVPLAGGIWGLCEPTNPKNERMRPSILVEKNGRSLLIDIGPDFRFQTSRAKVIPDAIMITHGHWDHIAGIGELPYYMEEVLKGDLNIYADEICMSSIRGMFPYLFFNEQKNGANSSVGFGKIQAVSDFLEPHKRFRSLRGQWDRDNTNFAKSRWSGQLRR